MVLRQEEHLVEKKSGSTADLPRLRSWVSSIGQQRKQLITVVLAGLVFVAVVLKINHRLFSIPINEYFDYAANTLQIEDAKHFRTLLGNYSAWGFHHPGPAFFYLFALGELLSHDWLRLVPEVMNAQLVTVIILNSIFLFASIGIFARHCNSKLFVPAAVASSIYFVYLINHIAIGSALLSIWMPHVLLFPFLLFVTVGASVASGNAGHLPVMVFAGLLLLHGHVAQPLFVLPLTAIALVGLWFSRGRQLGLGRFLKINRKAVWISAALLAVFAFPILLDLLIHRPNNIQRILVHMSAHPGLRHGWREASHYEINLLTVLPDPDVVLPNLWLQLSRGSLQPYVAVNWCLCAFLGGLTIGKLVYGRRSVPIFVRWLGADILIVLLLFLYWSMKMSGTQTGFNGYFFYSVQLLLMLAMLCVLFEGTAPHLNWLTVTALSCAVPLLMLLAKPYFLNAETGSEETRRMIAGLPPDIGLVRFQFPNDDWESIVGVASRMKRDGHPFCVTDNYWAWFFGQDNICGTEMTRLQNLIFTRVPRKCELPCRTLVQAPGFTLQLSPYPWLNLPFRLESEGIKSLNENFFGDPGGLWATRDSTIHFLLAPDFRQNRVKITISGNTLPGRPVDVSLNGRRLGTISSGQSSAEFVVDGSVLLAGRENGLRFEVRNAGPILHDWRELGFYVTGVEFERLGQ